MGQCSICGKWAGLLKPVHDACLYHAALSEVSVVPPSAAPPSGQSATGALAVGFSFGIPLPPNAFKPGDPQPEWFDDVFPFRELENWACYIPLHQKIGEFVAKRYDPIWFVLKPPFCEGCNCGLLDRLADEATPEAMTPGLSRFDKKLLLKLTHLRGKEREAIRSLVDLLQKS